MKLRSLLELASPTPGCECDTCRAIRIARGDLTRLDLARAGSHSGSLKSDGSNQETSSEVQREGLASRDGAS